MASGKSKLNGTQEDQKESLAAQQMPATNLATPAGSSTGNPRNKVALKPGHSLMDWIKLGQSGKDLTGVGGKLRDVSMDELAKHCRKEDAWIALKGRVYNVTYYMQFHPGGEDELMRGVGQDATDLFNEVHRWVNFESMLQKCLIGKLKASTTSLLKQSGRRLLGLDRRKVTGSTLSPSPSGNLDISPLCPPPNGMVAPPRHDWFQKQKAVMIIVYTKWSAVTSDRVVLHISDKIVVKMLIYLAEHVFCIHVNMEDEVEGNGELRISSDTGKVELVLQKVKEGIWRQLGEPLERHKTMTPFSQFQCSFHSWRVVSIVQVTHNTKLFVVQPVDKSRHQLSPLGFHVHLRAIVSGEEVCRSYTPVPAAFVSSIDGLKSTNDTSSLHLVVKLYPEGGLTPHLHSLSSGSEIDVSDPVGSFFVTDHLSKSRKLFLLAAGTGITPMIGLIMWALSRLERSKEHIHLAFFNKSEADIICRERLEQLTSEHPRFQVSHVLSSPEPGWTGLRGHISLELYEQLGVTKDLPLTYVAICGPVEFVAQSNKYLMNVGCSPERIHVFSG